MIKIAHRGLAGLYPENTILSFSKALDYNPDAIELDVQLTKDNIPIVFHDEKLDRTTGANGFVKDFTYTDLLALNANNGFYGVNEKIPTLDDYFDLISGLKIKTFVELKNSFIIYPGIEEIVFSTIKNHNMIDKCIIYSANHYSVMNYKRNICPESDVCLPFDNWIYDYGEYCEKLGVTKSIPYFKALNQTIIDDFHNHKVSVYPWTVDNPDEMKKMADLGCDGILSNRIDILTNKF